MTSHLAAVAEGLSCGLVGKIVARLEENCKWLLGRWVRPVGRWVWLGVI